MLLDFHVFYESMYPGSIPDRGGRTRTYTPRRFSAVPRTRTNDTRVAGHRPPIRPRYPLVPPFSNGKPTDRPTKYISTYPLPRNVSFARRELFPQRRTRPCPTERRLERLFPRAHGRTRVACKSEEKKQKLIYIESTHIHIYQLSSIIVTILLRIIICTNFMLRYKINDKTTSSGARIYSEARRCSS